VDYGPRVAHDLVINLVRGVQGNYEPEPSQGISVDLVDVDGGSCTARDEWRYTKRRATTITTNL